MQNKIMGHKKFMDKTNVGSQIVLSKKMLILKTILFQKDFNPKKVSVYKSFRSKHFGYKKFLRLKNVWSDQSRPRYCCYEQILPGQMSPGQMSP